MSNIIDKAEHFAATYMAFQAAQGKKDFTLKMEHKDNADKLIRIKVHLEVLEGQEFLDDGVRQATVETKAEKETKKWFGTS